jgi:hypothetical protein
MADIPTEGTVDKPYRQNPPRLFQEVHWVGGTFAASVLIEVPEAANAVFLWSETWEEAKTLSAAGNFYNPRAGAFGNPNSTPTFVLGGYNSFHLGEGFSRFAAWIEASTDVGETWARGYDGANSQVVSIVYSKTEEVFYAQAASDLKGFTPDFTWLLLKSSDGMGWGVAETAPGGPDAHRYVFPAMNAAADPIYQDGDGNNCCGGVYGYDRARKILMAPYPDVVAATLDNKSYGWQVQIRKEDEDGDRTFDYVDIPGIDQVYSVAYSGGVWQAAGSGSGPIPRIATSTDDGETWLTTYSGSEGRVLVALGTSL